MFINWILFLIPKAFFILSIVINQGFISLVQTEREFHFGEYRYLLYFSALFNMIASLMDVLIPVSIHTYRSAIVVFVVDGFYSDKSMKNETLIAIRLALIGGTYAILSSHFIFRYSSLRHNYYISKYFYPYGLQAAVCFVFVHIIIWTLVTDETMTSKDELREYIRESFEQSFGIMENVNMKVWIFSEASSQFVFWSWTGIILVTVIALYSIIILYFVLGYKIMSGLCRGLTTMSHKTTQMQKRLFFALSVQTSITILVSFMPFTLVLHASVFRYDIPSWMNWVSSVALSMFPVLGPMAKVLCLPTLRHRLFLTIGFKIAPRASNRIQTIPNV